MTSYLVYGQRGRKLIFIHAAINWYDEVLGERPQDVGWDDLVATGYLVAAGTALMIPDPGSTLLGWGATKAANFSRARATGALSWWAKQPIAKKSAIGYVLLTPLMLENAQIRKAETGVRDFDAALGEAMWEAQAVPNTERLQVPQAVNPMTGGRVF